MVICLDRSNSDLSHTIIALLSNASVASYICFNISLWDKSSGLKQECFIEYLIQYTKNDQMKLKISKFVVLRETILLIEDSFQKSIGIVIY